MSDAPSMKHGGERSDRRINAGHNRAENVTLARIENINKRGTNGNENIMIVDSHGKVTFDSSKNPHFRHTRTSVNADQIGQQQLAAAAKDSIVTHSHPNRPRQGLAGAIGNTLSSADILSATRWNAKEIRATTPTYTYSMKRPKGGWGASSEQIRTAIGSTGKFFYGADGKFHQRGGSGIHGEMGRKMVDYVNKHGTSDAMQTRMNTVYQHQAMKEIAKRFGWNYTRKKNV
jgi:hypothetical protein